MKHLLILLVFFADMACADILPEAGGRLLATGGVTQIEGAGGGGLVPWALISGYGTRDQVGLTALYTQADPSDFRLRSAGVAIGIHDRVEISLAQQRLGLGSTVPGQSIDQNMLGIKLRVLGDAVFDQDRWWPQVAVGAIYKHNEDMAVPRSLGAKRDADTDFYVSATKVYRPVYFFATGCWWARNTARSRTISARSRSRITTTSSLRSYRTSAFPLRPPMQIWARSPTRRISMRSISPRSWPSSFCAHRPRKHPRAAAINSDTSPSSVLNFADG